MILSSSFMSYKLYVTHFDALLLDAFFGSFTVSLLDLTVRCLVVTFLPAVLLAQFLFVQLPLIIKDPQTQNSDNEITPLIYIIPHE